MRETVLTPDDLASPLRLAAAALMLCLLAPQPAAAQDPGPGVAPAPLETPAPPPDSDGGGLDRLFERLAAAGPDRWEPIEAQIRTELSRSGSASMDLLLRRASEAMEAKEFERAEMHLDDLVRLAPDFAEGWNRRATLHFIRKDYLASLSDIRQVLALEPRHFAALAGLGMILLEFGDKEGALSALREAKRLHPNMPKLSERIEDLAPDVDGREL